MKRSARCLLVFAAASAHAGGVDFIDVAPVVSVTPLYGPVTDARDCAPAAPQPMVAGVPQQQVPPQPPVQDRSVIAPALGGVAGAVLGSQVGSGRGRDAATAVGAVAGTVLADRVANPNSPGSTTGAVVGGAAGALLGNQVGQGSGRTAATAAGAIGGSMIGDRVMSGGAPTPAPAPIAAAPMMGQPQAQPCRVVDGVTREAIRGYSVVYRYGGRDITTTMPYHPGNSIRVAVGAADSMVAQPAPPPAPAGYAAPGMVPYPQQGSQQPVPGGTYIQR